jgi:hypothetical protein
MMRNGGELQRKLRPTAGCDGKQEEEIIVVLKEFHCHFAEPWRSEKRVGNTGLQRQTSGL